MGNFKVILKILSMISSIISASMLLCISIAIIYNEDFMPFVITFAIAASTSAIFFISTKNKYITETRFSIREACLTVVLSWLFITIFGSLPYIFSNSIPKFINALFESVSGFSTTGASILTDIEVLPMSILFWRSFTHWIGGIGIIVLVIIVLPIMKIGSYQLFTTESSLKEKIKPRARSVGKRLLVIYILLTFAETLLLILGGMSVFDSFCHSFGTIATGGFSTKNSSIAEYSSYIQVIIMLFMLLAGVNFGLYHYLLKGNLKKIFKNEEFKAYLLTVFAISSLVSIILIVNNTGNSLLLIRDAFFQVISIITCTGFCTTDYLQWSVAAWVLIFFSMFIGGCMGSTSGGIKIVRHIAWIKTIKMTLINQFSNAKVVPVKINKHIIENNTLNSFVAYTFIYFFIFLISSFLMFSIGNDFDTSVSSVATCMAGIGPGLGTVGPVSNFAHLSDLSKIILSILMLFGRIEFYPALIILNPKFWKLF